MARIEADGKLGFYPQPVPMAKAIAQLFAPNGLSRVGDFCAGEGVALQMLATHTGAMPMANEIERGKFEECLNRFHYAAEGDFFSLDASRNVVQALILNPPYSLDANASGENKRREYQFFKRAIDKSWVQEDGYIIGVLYTQHLTSNFFTLLAGHCSEIDIWGWDGTILDRYKHVAVIAKIGKPNRDKLEWAKELKAHADAENFRSLQDEHQENLYTLPNPSLASDRMVFRQEIIDIHTRVRSVLDAGADRSTAFQTWFSPNITVKQQNPVWNVKMNHALTLVEAGLTDEVWLTQADGNKAVLRSVVAPYTSDPEVVGEGKGGKVKLKSITSMRSTLYMTTNDGVTTTIGQDKIVEFMRLHGDQILEENRKVYPPLFDVSLPEVEDLAKQQWLPKIRNYKVKGKHEFYGVQQMVTNAALNYLVNNRRRGMYLALDPRCGKSPITVAMIGATIEARMNGEIDDYDARQGDVHIIQCPGNLLDKWKREVEGMIPGANVITVSLEDADGHGHDILADVAKFMDDAALRPLGAVNIMIINMNSVKFGEGEPAPAYIHTRQQGYHDPVTGIHIDMEEMEKIADTKHFVEGWTYKGSYAPHTNEKGGEWKHITGRQLPVFCDVRRYRKPKAGNGRIDNVMGQDINLTGEDILDPWIANKGTRYSKNPRVQLHILLKARYQHRIGYFFVDEVHHSGSEGTDINASTVAIAQLARKVVGLTGTISRGVASGIYDLERVINPEKLFEYYPYGDEGRRRWISDMGFLVQFTEEEGDMVERGDFSGVKRSKKQIRENPGTTPLLVKWILPHAIFVALRDLGAPLVDYTHVNQVHSFIDEQVEAHEDLTERIEEGVEHVSKLMEFGFLKNHVNTPFYPMEVYGWEYIRDDGKLIDKVRKSYGFTDPIPEEVVLPKELALIQYVRERLQQGRGVCVYVQQTGIRDYQERLEKLIADNVIEAKPFILRTSIDQVKREAYINRQVAKGCNVMICNPTLVQEGFDLIDFPCYWWHEHTEKSILVIQASARGWGIPQTKPSEVMFPVYAGTIEEVIVARVAQKIYAHEVLKGDKVGLSGTMSEEGGDVLDAILKDMGKGVKYDLNAMFADINAAIKANGSGTTVNVVSLPEAQPELQPAPIIDIDKPYCPRLRSPFAGPAYNWLRKSDKLPLPEEIEGMQVADIKVRVKLFSGPEDLRLYVTAYNPETGDLVGWRTQGNSFEPFHYDIKDIWHWRCAGLNLPIERDVHFGVRTLAEAWKRDGHEAGLAWLNTWNVIGDEVVIENVQEPLTLIATVEDKNEPVSVQQNVPEIVPVSAPCPDIKQIKKAFKEWNSFWTKDMIANNREWYQVPEGKKFILDSERQVVWVFGKAEHRRISVLNNQPVAEVIFAA